jgi:hypothetical protein
MRRRLRAWAVVVSAIVTLSTAPASTQNPPAGTKPPVTTETPWPDASVIAERKRESERRRLFRSDDILPVTLTADFRAVQRDRDPKSELLFPASITFAGNDGSAETVPVKIRTRGHSRRNASTCTFAPLQLEFEKAAVRGTVFDGHGPLKLGTHCRRGSEDIILREHVLYKAFALLTSKSFRSRVAQVTYADSRTGDRFEQPGLFLEDDDDVARRMEGRIVELQNATFPRVDRDTLATVMLFQYLVGNTDLSIMVQHNIRLVQTQDTIRHTVPFDWDYAGVVDAGYAVPAKSLGIADVRDRLYRGPCRTLQEWQPIFDRFRAVKARMMEQFDLVAGLSASYRREAKSYLESGFRVLDSPSLVKRELIDTCQKIGM